MELFKQNSKIDFMGARLWTAMLSLVLFIASLTSLFVYGLHCRDLDFTGGTQIEVAYTHPADISGIRFTSHDGSRS